jgi:D-psicose/D-tagatose/L-ribulose 3-epimerase
MLYGMNLFLWTGELNESVVPVVDALKSMGYDGVELPLLNLESEKVYADWGKRLDGLKLRRTGCTVRGAADNPISADPKIRAAGIANNKRALDCAAAAGVETLIGPYHSALGEFSGRGPTEDEWKRGVEAMREVAEHAAKVNVKIGVEWLNRFECYLLNCAEDAARFVREVNHPNCKLMYDTFHANIEEKNIAKAVQASAKDLIHVHISENDRSTPGKGDIKWAETFDALKSINYQGWLMVEAFGLALPEIAAATKIWRRMFDSETQLAKDALAFMKEQVAKRS